MLRVESNLLVGLLETQLMSKIVLRREVPFGASAVDYDNVYLAVIDRQGKAYLPLLDCIEIYDDTEYVIIEK